MSDANGTTSASRDEAVAAAKGHVSDVGQRYADLWFATADKMIAGDYGFKAMTQDAATVWSTWAADVANCWRLAADVAKTYAPPAAPATPGGSTGSGTSTGPTG